MTGGCWPTAEQTLLLQATLLDADGARRALDTWRSRVSIDRLDRGSRGLLPLLYERLAEAGRDESSDPLLRALRKAYEQTSARNGALIEAAAAAIRTLGAAGMETMVLKGMALIARGILTPGARPMADVDLLVPEVLALDARDTLLAHGWQLEGRMNSGLLPLRHAVSFCRPMGQRLDLHWHALAECCGAGADADFWRAAEPAAMNGAATRTLCAADMVLHACVHGAQWSVVPPVRWAVDALMVIRRADPPVDWERLAYQAERRRLVLPMIDTLRYLREALEAPVPEEICDRLSRATVPRWVRMEYVVKRQRRSARRQLAFHWFQHRRLRSSGTMLGDLVRFPSYLHRRWHFRTARHRRE